LISRAPRGFRHSGAGLTRELDGAWAGALRGFETPPLYGGIRSQPDFVVVAPVFLSCAEGLSALGGGPAAGAWRGGRPARISRGSAIFLVFRHAGGQRDSFLPIHTELVDCSHSGAISASGAASRGARKTTSAPPSSRASPRSPPAPRSGSATAACSRGNRCRSSSRKSRL